MSRIKQFKKSAIVIPAAVLLVAVGTFNAAYAADDDSQDNRHPSQGHSIHLQIKRAIASADYQTFEMLIEDAPFEVDVDEETFAKMVEAHTLMEAGDIEAAHEAMEEIGFPMRRQHGLRPAAEGAGENSMIDDLTDE